jgi:hypothetical protein
MSDNGSIALCFCALMLTIVACAAVCSFAPPETCSDWADGNANKTYEGEEFQRRLDACVRERAEQPEAP